MNNIRDPMYINYASCAINILIKIKDDLRPFYYFALDTLIDDSIFTDREKLIEYNKYHIELFFANPTEFQESKDFVSTSSMEYVLMFSYTNEHVSNK